MVKKAIIDTKTEAIHRQDQIIRLKAQMTKYQGLLREHNVALEAEVYFRDGFNDIRNWETKRAKQ